MEILRLTSAALLFAVTLGGCATWTPEQKGTAVGAAAGGVVGHAVSGGSTLGTVGGAVAGGVIGHEVGKRNK